MSGVTNKLIEDYKVTVDISDPEYDVVLSTGEPSIALISAMLNKEPSRSMLGCGIQPF